VAIARRLQEPIAPRGQRFVAAEIRFIAPDMPRRADFRAFPGRQENEAGTKIFSDLGIR